MKLIIITMTMLLAMSLTSQAASHREVTCEGILFGNHQYLTLDDKSKRPECWAEIRRDYPEVEESGGIMRKQVLSVCKLEKPCRIKGIINIGGISDDKDGALWVRVDKVERIK